MKNNAFQGFIHLVTYFAHSRQTSRNCGYIGRYVNYDIIIIHCGIIVGRQQYVLCVYHIIIKISININYLPWLKI